MKGATFFIVVSITASHYHSQPRQVKYTKRTRKEKKRKKKKRKGARIFGAKEQPCKAG